MIQTFYDFIIGIIGQYQPIVIYDSNNEVVESCIDFGYILGVLILIVFIYYVLKTIGGIIYEWCR